MPEIYLPPEIWRYVVQSICLHCSRDGSNPTTPQDRHRHAAASSRALLNLCLTSTMLNRLATPCLYHVPITKKVLALFQKLLDNPDLARHVRELHNDTCSGWPSWDYSNRDRQYAMQRHHPENQGTLTSRSRYPPAFLELYDSLRQHTPEIHDHDRPTEPGDQTLSACGPGAMWIEDHQRDTTLVSLLPNLTTFSVVVRWCRICIGHLRLPPGFLSKLTSASFVSKDDHDVSRTWDLRRLPELAPNLTSLHLVYFGGEINSSTELFVFPNVTHLSMEHARFSGSSLTDFIDSFPRLERLDFHQHYLYYPAPDIIMDLSLSRQRFGLRSLSIDCFDANSGRIRPWTSLGHYLSDMENLEVLKVDQTCICIPEPDIPEATSPETPPWERKPDNMGSINMNELPSWIKALHIFCYWWPSQDKLWQAVLSFARAAPQRFPALKNVVLEFEGTCRVDAQLQRTWEKADVWEEVGIRLTCTELPTRPILG
ncbi:hypothetical protein B0T11DRAFT_292673 [Plectosphaerella cucumerina]|uniref:F-box domain-containing protein n=1 Tax=Plectosphaerella cucumerina TaxID=40658 RepID=A0A8K0X7I5_9PEZI|nr:hypothetical protein B0T11DRAFT_292673 [Plectosphaerella cucumerina]